MQILTNPNGLNIIAKVPDAVGSMFDEELFVEIIDPAGFYTNGSYFNLSVNGLSVDILMWNGKGRYYLDGFSFTDFTKAVYHVEITSPFYYAFDLFPKKSVGDILTIENKLLPFWDGDNIFSATYDIDVFKYSEGGNIKITVPKNTKNTVSGIEKYFSGVKGAYTEEYTEQYMIPSSGYYIETRKVCTDHVFFSWIDDNGFWRSWYFLLAETKNSSKGATVDLVKNISASFNERVNKIDQKKTTISKIFTSGNEPKEVLEILNLIKSSSYVFMGSERVNVKSEDTTDFKDIDEFIFTVINETKTAI